MKIRWVRCLRNDNHVKFFLGYSSVGFFKLQTRESKEDAWVDVEFENVDDDFAPMVPFDAEVREPTKKSQTFREYFQKYEKGKV